jgi:hypothetical protein
VLVSHTVLSKDDQYSILAFKDNLHQDFCPSCPFLSMSKCSADADQQQLQTLTALNFDLPSSHFASVAASCGIHSSLHEQHRMVDRVNYFARLHAVEVALVMQMLNNTSILAVAATSTRMLADALQPLSWKYAETVLITDEQLLHQKSKEYGAHSLMKLAPVHLQLQCSEWPSRTLLPFLEQLRYHDYSAAPLLQQLTTTAGVLQHLKTLKLNTELTGAVLRPLGRCTQLTSLDLSANKGVPKACVELLQQTLTQLLQQPQLTELALRKFWRLATNSLLQPLVSSPGHLRRLHLDCVLPGFESFSALAVALPKLQVLSLAHFPTINPAYAKSILQLFTLPALHTLQLVCLHDLKGMLPLITTIPRLRKLLIFSYPDASEIRASRMAAPQTIMPQLHITEGEWRCHSYPWTTWRLTYKAQHTQQQKIQIVDLADWP